VAERKATEPIMRITWIVATAVTERDGAWYSPLASMRYRVLSPARYLQDAGHSVQFLHVDATTDPAAFDSFLSADITVISKVFAGSSVGLAQRAIQLGSQIVLDICDDHFDTPQLAETYFSLCKIAHRITASTRAMAETISRRTGRQAVIIDDPFEAPAGVATFNPAEPLKLLWFGHASNFDTVVSMLPELAMLSESVPLQLALVTTDQNASIAQYLKQFAASIAPQLTRLSTALTPWSEAATWQAMQRSDMIVIPSLPAAKKQVKSPNRAVESIRSGRLVIAYPLPSYAELADYLCLGESMADGIRHAMKHPDDSLQRITAGQAYIAERFSMRTIGRAWDAVLSQTVDCAAVA